MITRTLAELADLCGAELDGDGTLGIDGPASLREASGREISFFAHPKYRAEVESTRAAAVLVPRDFVSPRPDLALLRCDDPNAAFSAVVGAFVTPETRAPSGVHASAFVDPAAVVAAGASIGPLCAIGPEARIETGAVLHASVVVGRGARVGAGTTLHPGVVLYAGVSVGARCILHGGAVIGSDGFGFLPQGKTGAWVKIPQVGTVVVEDDVEIGANVTVDRGRFGATRIGKGAKIDNLVHIAHNVVIGEGALLVAQVGIAGSTRIGKGAILAGQSGVNGHSDVGAGARIAARAGVFGDVPAGADYFGYPARPRKEALRQEALVLRLPELHERLKSLEKRLAAMEADRA